MCVEKLLQCLFYGAALNSYYMDTFFRFKKITYQALHKKRICNT